MTEIPPAEPVPAPLWKPLSPRQRRVLGVLIEKAKTTPASYPLTLNAVVLGCNQKNNREPLMSLAASDVEQVLDELRALGVVTVIEGSGRVTKYRHEAYRWLGVSRPEIAVMAELLLRGEQTLGELRARAARMEPIADLATLKPIVDSLIQRGLMIEITGPGRGQVIGHNLYQERERDELRARYEGRAPLESAEPPSLRSTPAAAPAPPPAIPPEQLDALSEEVATLREEVATLREEVVALREEVRKLETRLDSALG